MIFNKIKSSGWPKYSDLYEEFEMCHDFLKLTREEIMLFCRTNVSMFSIFFVEKFF